MKLFVTSEGFGKPNILFIHGIWGGGNYFRKLNFSDLPGTHYFPDELGFGKSPKPNVEYTLQRHCEEIANSVPDKNYIVIGNSFGSTIAVIFASLYPEKVKKLILLSPVIHKNKAEAEHYLSTKFIPRTAIHSPKLLKLLCHVFCSTKLFELAVPFIRTEQHNNLKGCTEHTWFSFYSTFINGFLKEPAGYTFEHVADSIQTNILAGEHDGYVNLKTIQRLKGKHLTVEVLSETTHNALFEQFDECKQMIKKWI